VTAPSSAPVHPLSIAVGAPYAKRLTFEAAFRIGRTADCELQIPDEHVSRSHAAVSFENGQWVVRDLGSANGLFLNGARVKSAVVNGDLVLRFGIQGPEVSFHADPPPAVPKPTASLDQYAAKYFGKHESPEAGDHTRMVRQAFTQVQTRQKRRFGVALAALAICGLAGAGYGFYEHQQSAKHKAMAQDLFYSMKSLDVDIAGVEKLISDSGSGQGMEQVRKYQNRRREMEKNYDQFLDSLHVYNAKISEEDRLVLRVSRIFGECELAMPPDFLDEVKAYIKKWQSSERYARAVKKAKENGYATTIAHEMLAQDLPPQFFYLAMQESDFDPLISGPETRKGIAKGMWQFIPETAVKYGLHVGPLADLRRPDPGDDRHHWDRETKAAASYLKTLYTTDAQASGLLVMASYNWGEDYVLPLVRKMPANPRDRNFWKLLAGYRDKVPKETYDYVFYITAAAVIGENPRLFGFDFDNPLGELESK
jgi:membrane-bound lytic murein transglycosylase D